MFAMRAPYATKRITFDHSEGNPSDTLDVCMPKLNENEVLVPCTTMASKAGTLGDRSAATL